MNAVIDIESLALTADAIILQIGAVLFDEKNVYIRSPQPFEAWITTHSQPGRRIDHDTVMWWFNPQQDEARTYLWRKRAFACSLTAALDSLTFWFHVNQPTELWARGPQFDVAALEHAYASMGRSVPWGHRAPRNVRTLMSTHQGSDDFPDVALIAEKLLKRSTKHDALYDAIEDAVIVRALLGYPPLG